MIIFYILLLVNLFALTYFAARFHERILRNAKDINAIAQRLRIQEDSCKAHEIAYDFRIKVIENQFSLNPDTGFNVRHFKNDDL